MLPQLELFESGFDDELKWLDEALNALEAYKNVNTLEEVERELGRYTVGRQLLPSLTVLLCIYCGSIFYPWYNLVFCQCFSVW